MNLCTHYLLGNHSVTVCGREGPFMVGGNSYCRQHVELALAGITYTSRQTIARSLRQIMVMQAKIDEKDPG